MSNIPRDRKGLDAAGYRFSGVGFCRSCKAPIEWHVTPNKKKMPMSVSIDKDTNHEVLRPHWETCPDAIAWRRANRAHKERTEPAKPKQGGLFVN